MNYRLFQIDKKVILYFTLIFLLALPMPARTEDEGVDEDFYFLIKRSDEFLINLYNGVQMEPSEWLSLSCRLSLDYLFWSDFKLFSSLGLERMTKAATSDTRKNGGFEGLEVVEIKYADDLEAYQVTTKVTFKNGKTRMRHNFWHMASGKWMVRSVFGV